MKIKTGYIERELFYSTINENWKDELPIDNWCLILIANETTEELLNEIIHESITKNVGYVCAIGTMHNYIHNKTDIEYVIRDLGESKLPKPKYHIMTVGDEDFEEGIWFGLMCTFSCVVEIDKIQIIDTDCKWKNQILQLIKRFEEGYLPEHE